MLPVGRILLWTACARAQQAQLTAHDSVVVDAYDGGMRPGGGKAKGAEFERQVCKRLSMWISRGKRDDLFWRSAMSGGRATIGKAAGADRGAQVGDISAISDGGKYTDVAARFISFFVVECKSVKNYQLDLFLFEGRGVIQNAIDQCALASRVKSPLIILKQNRGREIVVFRGDAISSDGMINTRALKRYALIECVGDDGETDYYVASLADFLLQCRCA